MKVGDLVQVKEVHWADRGVVGVIVEDVFPLSHENQGKAWRVLFPNGKIKPKLAKTLEVVNENR